jgi:hypothetical protein
VVADIGYTGARQENAVFGGRKRNQNWKRERKLFTMKRIPNTTHHTEELSVEYF